MNKVTYLEGSYRKQYSLKERKGKAKSILSQYPDRCLVIVEAKRQTDPPIDKRQFMVQREMTYGQFTWILRKRLKLNQGDAIFTMIGDEQMSPCNSTLMSHVYDEHKDAHDYALYVTYARETVFG